MTLLKAVTVGRQLGDRLNVVRQFKALKGLWTTNYATPRITSKIERTHKFYAPISAPNGPKWKGSKKGKTITEIRKELGSSKVY